MLFFINETPLRQCFLNGVPRNPRGPRRVSGVPRSLSKFKKEKKNIKLQKMEYIKWKTYIIIAFIDLLSVYLAVVLFMDIL